MREYLFDASLIVAVNALLGRKVSGFGIANLRNCAQYGPALRLTPEGISVSYQWIGPNDVASQSVSEKLAIIVGQKISVRFHDPIRAVKLIGIAAERRVGQASKEPLKYSGTDSYSLSETYSSNETGCT